ISLEPGALSADIVKKLEAMGHKVSSEDSVWGRMQAVEWDRASNTLSGGTDPRNPVGKAEVIKAR
ncbi:MAG TPA: gamma-glutamyltransferase, partial [Xanthomonadaceae bacterium]|nr:gamma-glutamyltransferase [Xanthomonadaceae bacterium]